MRDECQHPQLNRLGAYMSGCRCPACERYAETRRMTREERTERKQHDIRKVWPDDD